MWTLADRGLSVAEQRARRVLDVREVVEEVSWVVGLQADKKGLEVTAHIDPALPERMCGDAGRLRQILFNLCGNAVKFTAQGEVALEVELLNRTEERICARFEVRARRFRSRPRTDSGGAPGSCTEASTRC